jgi:type II secretory pathway pseudopilin PulG
VTSLNQKGFSLVEALVSLGLFAAASLLITSALSFSMVSIRESRKEMEAARSAGQVLEILRSTGFDSLNLVEDGGLSIEPLSKFQQSILRDVEDRLSDEDLSVYLTIREYLGRSECKQVFITVASTGLKPSTNPLEVPPGKILVTKTTLVTKKGINP